MSGVLSSAVTSTRMGSPSACSARAASASAGVAARPPGSSANDFPFSLAAESAATTRGGRPLGVNHNPPPIDARHEPQGGAPAVAGLALFAVLSAILAGL